MVKLAAKNLIFWLLALAFARLKQSTPQQRSQHNKLDYNEPFGIGRKAMGTTPLPCARRVVLVMLPSDAYTG
jgi:hypothetical protein